MNKFNLISKTEVTGKYLTYSHNEYTIQDAKKDTKEVITDFLSFDNFKQDDFSAVVKLLPSNEYLGHALNLDKININDFKLVDCSSLINYLDKLITKESNIESIKEARYINDKLIQFIKSIKTENFYFIGRDFFNLESKNGLMIDSRIEFAMSVYNPYLLIIWINDWVLNVCQMASD